MTTDIVKPEPGWYWATDADGSGTPIEVQASLGHNPIYGWHGITDYQLPVGLTLGPRVEDLLRDAERYQWVRSGNRIIMDAELVYDLMDRAVSEQDFDAAIDAEIAREKETP